MIDKRRHAPPWKEGIVKKIHELGLAGLLIVLAGIVFASSANAQHVDFEVAQDGTPQRKLKVEGDADILSGVEPLVLELVPSGPLAGLYAIGQPGWESIPMDEPGEGLFKLVTPHSVALRRVSWQTGFQMYDNSLSPILTTDGSNYSFPQSPPGEFHQDLTFALDPNDFPAGSTVTGTFRLVDPSGTHADSDVFTLALLLPVETPTMSEWGMVAMIGLMTTAGTLVLRNRLRYALAV